jgi:hypothetical protein
MVAEGQDPAWPDKAMFAAILLMLAGALGLLFRLVYDSLVINDEDLLSLGEPTSVWGTLLCAATFIAGVMCLLRQAATYAYIGAACAVASLSVYGLVPALGFVAVVFMVLSHREGEETHNDGVELSPSLWPDKAMASSLFLVVVGGVALTQGLLILGDRFDPVLLTEFPLVAGIGGIAIGLLALVAARETYHVQRPWLAWTAYLLSFATLGFYLIGPAFALVGMTLLGLAHREGEFTDFAGDVLAVKARRRRGRPGKPAAT